MDEGKEGAYPGSVGPGIERRRRGFLWSMPPANRFPKTPAPRANDDVVEYGDLVSSVSYQLPIYTVDQMNGRLDFLGTIVLHMQRLYRSDDKSIHMCYVLDFGRP
jgi:hypothetical protein